MKLKLVYSLRLLFIANLFVFTMWSLLLVLKKDAHSNVEHSNLKNSDDKDTEKRINKLKKSLKNRYPSQLDYIEAYIVKDLPVIYAVTPTYTRWTQKADLTRLAQTLLHVPNLHWIVVEDAERKTPLVTKFLKYSGLQYTHLNSKTDANYKLKADDPNWLLPRGVAQRNAGLSWIRKNVPPSTSGVLYLMDDDNTYSLKLFEEMRTIATAAVWPVGLTGGLKFEGPGSCSGGKVLSWYTAWKPERPFPIDMAGFAVNLKLFFQHKNAEFSNKVPRGYLESHFLTSLDLTRDDVEGKVEDCSEILVWHTRTEKATLKQEAKLISMGNPSNPDIEV